MNVNRQRLLLATAVAAAALVAIDHLRGGDEAPPGEAPELAAIVVPPVRAATPPPEPAGLDLWRIAQRNATADRPLDAFEVRSWVRPPPPAPPPPPAEAPPPPPPPQAPALPYTYLGRLDESPERTLWYLADGERLLVVATGDTVDGSWRLDGADAAQLRFTFVPLGQTRSLPFGAAP